MQNKDDGTDYESPKGQKSRVFAQISKQSLLFINVMWNENDVNNKFKLKNNFGQSQITVPLKYIFHLAISLLWQLSKYGQE